MTPDLRILRLTLVRELETINQYQEFLDAAESAAVRELMGHLMFEEKEHVAELTEMLKRFDPDQLAHFQAGHARAIGGPPEAPTGAPVAAGLPDAPGETPASGPAASVDSDPILTAEPTASPAAAPSLEAPELPEPGWRNGHRGRLTVGSLLGAPQG